MPPARILVVDDEPDLRSSLSLRLRGSGYDVHTATDAYEALGEVLGEPPALILLDIHLGEDDGHAFLDRLRRIPGARRIPVIFLTARAGAEDRDLARRRGAAGYITKPFEPSELMAAIAGALPVPA